MNKSDISDFSCSANHSFSIVEVEIALFDEQQLERVETEILIRMMRSKLELKTYWTTYHGKIKLLKVKTVRIPM